MIIHDGWEDADIADGGKVKRKVSALFFEVEWANERLQLARSKFVAEPPIRSSVISPERSVPLPLIRQSKHKFVGVHTRTRGQG